MKKRKSTARITGASRRSPKSRNRKSRAAGHPRAVWKGAVSFGLVYIPVHMHTAARDSTLVENTPIDYLDFASPVSGLGSKLGIDATNKWPGETARRWGRPIVMDSEVRRKIDELWPGLGL